MSKTSDDNIIGFPGEDPDTLREAMRWAKSLPELQALGARYFRAMRAWAGPNAVWIEDTRGPPDDDPDNRKLAARLVQDLDANFGAPAPEGDDTFDRIVAEARASRTRAEAKRKRAKAKSERDEGAPPIGEAKDAQVVLISAADIEPKPVNWLWRNGLQCGVFNLLAGQSTAGKSTIALSLAATITSGGKWPDGQTVKQGRVVFWSGEDDIEDTLLPRFLAAGGEQSMMHFIGGVRDGGRKRPFDPASDMPKLTRAVQSLRDVRMIVLDPIAVAVKGDSHKNVETRVGLQPFADLCMQTGACGLGVHHFTKNTAGGNPLDRVSGSLAFHALPRCVSVAARDQNGGQNARRALMRAKVSNGPDWGGFDYKLDQRSLENWPAIEAQGVLWGECRSWPGA